MVLITGPHLWHDLAADSEALSTRQEPVEREIHFSRRQIRLRRDKPSQRPPVRSGQTVQHQSVLVVAAGLEVALRIQLF